MFMEALKKFVITLVTVLIFMSAVEMIAPSKMKKYIKFVLGLILINYYIKSNIANCRRWRKKLYRCH